jgi:hypothetical protein
VLAAIAATAWGQLPGADWTVLQTRTVRIETVFADIDGDRIDVQILTHPSWLSHEGTEQADGVSTVTFRGRPGRNAAGLEKSQFILTDSYGGVTVVTRVAGVAPEWTRYGVTVAQGRTSATRTIERDGWLRRFDLLMGDEPATVTLIQQPQAIVRFRAVSVGAGETLAVTFPPPGLPVVGPLDLRIEFGRPVPWRDLVYPIFLIWADKPGE